MAVVSYDKRKVLLRYLPWVAALALLGLLTGYFTRPAPLLVKLVSVERGAVEATVSNTRVGTVKACRRAKLAPTAGGQIAHLRVKKGQRVKQDQVLLELWDEDLHAQERLAQQQLKVSQSRVQEVCTMADSAQRDAVRSQELRDKGFISAQQLDRALSDATARQAGCVSARGEIEQSRSRIAVAQANLQRMTLRAPFDGIVADISGELGEYATPSPPGIATLPAIDLIDDSCMYVSAPIDEADAASIKVGQAGRITLDAVKGKSYAGKIKRIAPYVLELEKQARTVEVEVAFVESPREENLLVGYSADVEIVHASHANVLRIPTSALLPTQTAQDSKRVLLYRPDGMLEERTVTTGLSSWERSEITAGLAEGDRIVLSPDKPGVKAGARVQPEIRK